MNWQLITGAFDGILKGLDGLFTSDEERLQAKNVIMLAQHEAMATALQYEQKIMEAQASVITSEAKGDSWIQKSWRPITMLTFVALVVAKWLGLTATVSEEIEKELMFLIQIGLGGYVVGRSAEKVAKAIDFKSIKAKED